MPVVIHGRDCAVGETGQIQGLNPWAATHVQDSGLRRKRLKHAKCLTRGLKVAGTSSRDVVVNLCKHRLRLD